MKVTREGDMFNMFTDSDNQTVRIPLGKIDDLVTFNVDSVRRPAWPFHEMTLPPPLRI